MTDEPLFTREPVAALLKVSVYGVFWTDDDHGCEHLTAIFNDEELARSHASLCGEVMRPIAILSTEPGHIVLFHAIYYSWLSPLASSDEAWSYEDDYPALIEKRKNLPPPEYWENGRGDWTLTAFGRTKDEAETGLNIAISARLNQPWTFADAKGKWLR